MSGVGNEERVEYPFYHDSAYVVRDMSTEFLSAVEKGNLEDVKLLLDRGVDVSRGSYCEPAPIIIATKKNYFEIVKLLLVHGVDVNCRDSYGCTPLAIAARKGFLEIVKLLIDKGSDVNSTDVYNCTPIGVAAREGNTEIVGVLIDNNVNVNARSQYSGTPLGVAAGFGRLETVRLLIDKGADVNSRNQYGRRTPLGAAVCHNFPEIARLLLDHSADASLSLSAALESPELPFDHTPIELLTKHVLLKNPNAKKPKFAAYKMSNYWDECSTQINKMTRQKIALSTIIFYEFLVSDEHKLASWVANKHVRQEINDGDYERKFPFYASEIKAQYQKGINRKALLEAAGSTVARFPGWPKTILPGVVEISLILQCLKNCDLQNLKEGFF